MGTNAYNTVADVLRRTKPLLNEVQYCSKSEYLSAHRKWRDVVVAAAETFAQQNPNFKRMRFFAACTLDPQ